jgi:Glycosyl transferase family 2
MPGRPDGAALEAALAQARAASDVAIRNRSSLQGGVVEAAKRRTRRLRHLDLRAERDRVRERVREQMQAHEERRLLAIARGGRDVCWTDQDTADPLVTVRIATYNRGPVVAERAIESVRNQTYENLEILVVGDACDEATSEAVRSVRDERLRFVNLPTRGTYPESPHARWQVAGTHPMNAALAMARGRWIAPCDDDDAFTPTHVERLLAHAITDRLELVWSRAAFRAADSWRVTAGPELKMGNISHGTVLYSLGLRFFRHSDTSWKLDEPGDWNLWRRMRDAGVRIGFLDDLTYLHY